MENYYKNELAKLTDGVQFKFYDAAGTVTKTMDLNEESRAALIEWLTLPEPERVRFTRINNDGNGNPRYVIHFLQLLTAEELNGTSLQKYEIALKRARKIGGRKFHNKQYGGGIVFQSYSLDSEVRAINRVLGMEKYVGYEID